MNINNWTVFIIICIAMYVSLDLTSNMSLFKEALTTILTKKIMFWKLVNSFKMMK